MINILIFTFLNLFVKITKVLEYFCDHKISDIMIKNVFHIKLLFILLLIASGFQARSQYYNIGQDPASIKWQQIKTENFTIIYPSDFAAKAQYLANTLQYVRTVGTKTLGHQPKHLTVILHNRTVVANAYSLWAPKRNEFFTCPPQNNYAQDWLEQLATHEYRHITQMDMLNQGFTKVAGWFFGQQVNTAVLGLFVPMWFMEGDAVATETLITKSGRGRIPSFEMKVRASVLGDKMFSYDKAVLGSYKDYVPDQYNFGYQMVAAARKKYGPDLWKTAMNYTGKYPFIITPFNRGLKKVSGLSKTKLYKSIFNDLDSLWKIQKEQNNYTSFRSVTPDAQKIYTNYKFAHYVNDSTILVEKSGMDDIARFIELDNKGKEKNIHTPGFYTYESLSITKTIDPNSGSDKNGPNSYTTDNLSLSKNFMVWAERKFDMRWSVHDYSVIITHNIKTGKTKQITKKSRYFAPYLFPDAQKIIAVEVTEDNLCSLVILNSSNGDVLKKLQAPGNGQYQTPSISDDGKKIIVVLFNYNGKSIVSVNPESGEVKTLLQPSFDEVTNPMMYKNYLLFNGIYSGIDNIYALDTLTGKTCQVTSAVYGAGDIDISPDGKKMIYSNYTPSGFQVAESAFNPETWTPIENIKDNSVQLYKSILPQESGLVDSANIPTKYYKPEKYHKWQHLFNPHSWAPAFIDGGNITFHPGVSVMSQNMLSTTFATLGYDYNTNMKTGKYYANISYRGWYPVFDFTYTNGKEGLLVTDSANNKNKYIWNSSDLLAGIRIPLTFTHGKYIQYVEPGIQTQSLLNSEIPDIPGYVVIDKRQILSYHVSAFNQIKSVERDMRPRWGQGIDLLYKNTPFNGADYGSILTGEFSLLFPGIGRHHSLMILGGIQKKSPGKYAFSDLLFYPRGYNKLKEFDGKLINDELQSISVNYKFPILYPDLKIGSLLYFKRFKANLFYDYSKGTTNSLPHEFNSTGIEITSDLNVVRFLFPVDLGFRATYLPKENKQVYEFLIGMNFTGF